MDLQDFSRMSMQSSQMLMDANEMTFSILRETKYQTSSFIILKTSVRVIQHATEIRVKLFQM